MTYNDSDLLKNVLENMNDGLSIHEIVYDENQKPYDYRIIAVNKQFEKILGIKRDSVLNKLATEAYKVKEPPYFKQYLEVATTGKPFIFQEYFKPLKKYFNISVFSPEKGKFGTIFSDITEKILTEKSISDLNSTLMAVRNVNKLIVTEKNIHVLIKKANEILVENGPYLKSFIVLTQKNDSHKVSLLISSEINDEHKVKSEFKHLDNLDNLECCRDNKDIKIIKNYEKYCSNCKIYNNEISGTSLSASLKYKNDFYGYIVVNSDNQKISKDEISLFREIADDISYALHTLDEEDYKVAHKHDVEKQKEKYKITLDSIKDSVLTTDRFGRIIYYNTAFSELTGFSPEEISNNTLDNLLKLDKNNTLVKKKAETTSSFFDDAAKLENRTLLLYTKDKTLVPVEISVSSLTDVNSKNIGAVIVIKDITIKYELLETRENQRQMLENVVESTFAGYWDWDIKSNTQYLSPRFKKMIGYEDYEIKNYQENTWQKYIHHEDLERTEQSIKNHIESKGKLPHYEEVRYRHKNGSIIWVLCSGKIVEWDKNENPVRMAGIHVDITERKRAEEALSNSKRRLSEYFNCAPDAIMVVDKQGNYIDINPASERITGYTKEELLHMNIEDFNLSDVKSRDFQVLQETGYVHFEKQFRRKDSSVGWWETTASKISENRYIGYAKDTTKRKEIELELFANKEKLKEAQKIARMGNFTNNITKDYWVSSGMYDEMVGIDTFYKRNKEGWLSFIHPDYRLLQEKEFIEKINVLKNTEKEQNYSTEYKIINQKTKKELWISDTGIYTYDSNNDVLKTGVIHDITERKTADTERKKLQQQLHQSQKMETIGTLAGGIAHDFNNILTPILGYADMLTYSLAENKAALEDLERIKSGANRAKELIQQILTFSRQTETNLHPLRIQLIIKEALKLLRPSIPSSIEIKKYINNDCLNVNADPTQIHQIFMNLCTNAVYAMKEQKGLLEIYLGNINHADIDDFYKKILDKENYILLTVTDTGEGMSKVIQEKIFEPFFTTKEQGKGTGLGLSVVHGIVKSYGGEIFVDSEIDKGTTFKVYFPALKTSSDSTGLANRKSTLIKGNKEKIFIIDDEQSVLSMLGRMLTMLNYEVETFSTYSKIMEAFNKNIPDLLITDLTMPEYTGLDLITKIRNQGISIPVVLVTGYGDKLNASIKEQLKINQIIGKPVSAKLLATVLKKILKG